jgi:hypothetical protein
MLLMAVAASEDMVGVTLEEGATMVAVVTVTPSTRIGTNFPHATCAVGLIIRCSNVIRDLI